MRESLSAAQALRKLDRATVGSNYDWVRREVQRFGLDTSHWGRAGARNTTPNLDEVFIENGAYSTGLVKTIILRERLLPELCAECGLGPSWRGKKLVLRLDHKNGKRSDHRLGNLRFLCPNCDSQTETFCGRNKRLPAKLCKCGVAIGQQSAACRSCTAKSRKPTTKIVWPPFEEVQERVKNTSFLATAKHLGVSDNAVRKFLRSRARVVEGAGF